MTSSVVTHLEGHSAFVIFFLPYPIYKTNTLVNTVGFTGDSQSEIPPSTSLTSSCLSDTPSPQPTTPPSPVSDSVLHLHCLCPLRKPQSPHKDPLLFCKKIPGILIRPVLKP